MVNDEERREVVARLRKMLVYMRARQDWYCEDADPVECGSVAYRNIAGSVEQFGNMISGNYIHIVERLAELIDRPTCNNVSEFGHNTASSFDFVCSHCGSRLIGDGMYCSPLVDDRFSHYGIKFCPNCGAEVDE